MFDENKYSIREYKKSDLENLLGFLGKCLLESGRIFEPKGVHGGLLQVENTYDYFVCLIENESGHIIGTCALKRMKEKTCELKCVYLYKEYYGQGLGMAMAKTIIHKAKENGYEDIYLDTISKTSARAIKMYERLGFNRCEKYHKTLYSDVFMKMRLY